MSLFSSLMRIEGGQYQHVPAPKKNYGAAYSIRQWGKNLLRDIDSSTHSCAQYPEDLQEDADVRMTLAKYQSFLDKMEHQPVRGERKRER